MTNEPELAAVTGGSGFIGTHLIQSLLSQNFHVRVLIRDPNKIEINHPLLEVCRGNLHDSDSLKSLVDKADYVIHCAGRVRGSTQAQFNSDNVLGTENLINACHSNHSLKKIILISSLAASQPDISYYSKSKYLAEQLCTNINFTKWTIIRPPAVYGPKDKELLPLFNWMNKGILWIPGNPKQKFSLLHVNDLVRLIGNQVTTHHSGNILEPDDGNTYDWDQIARYGGEFFERNIQKITIPKIALASVANINVILSRLLNYSPMLTPSKIGELMHNKWVSHGIEPSYKWTAQIDLKKGLSTLYSSK